MFQLDEKFLEDLGLGTMPEAQKKPFLQHIYEQLETKVGMRLSDGMSKEQLEEFENIIDRKTEVIDQWINKYAPDYANDELYKKIQQSLGANGANPSDPGLKAEYAATKWLEVNRPDYKDVVSNTLEELKQEIIKNKDAILNSR